VSNTLNYSLYHITSFRCLSRASLLVPIEEIITILLRRPLEVQREDNEGGGEGGPDEAGVVKAKGLTGRDGRINERLENFK